MATTQHAGHQPEPTNTLATTTDDAVHDALAAVFPGVDLTGHGARLRIVDVPVGQVVCATGDPADVAWIVIRGRLRILQESVGSPRVVADVGPGTLIGERGLTEGGRRTATVVARRDAVVAQVTREWIAALIAAEPGVLGHLVRALARPGDGAPDATEQVVAVLPAGVDRADVDALIDRLATMPGTVVARRPADAHDDTWLRDMEASATSVVLVADAGQTPWTREAVLLADRVVVLADATAPVPHPDEVALASLPDVVTPRRTTVFVHPATTDRAEGTAELLRQRPAGRHLHLRSGHGDDLARVARHLSGNAVALVISGGGARSLAAIGVFRELRRRGIPVDAVAGSSAGAVIAAAIAQGAEPDDLLRRCRDGFSKIRDPTVPVASLLRGGRLWHKLGEQFGSMDIEDTWVPFACTSTDLTDQVLVEHVRGPLRQAVRASVSLPGVFPPLEIDGHLHVDGGLLDNLPIHAVESLATDARIIAVDVSPNVGQQVPGLSPVVSGMSLVLRRLRRRDVSDVPSIAATLTQSALLSASRARRAAIEAASCHIDLSLERYAMLDFTKIDPIVDEGTRASAPVIDAWLEGAEPTIAFDEPWSAAIAVRDEGVDPELVTSRGRAVVGSLSLALSDLRFRLRRFMVAMVAAAVVLALLLLMTGVVNELDREPAVTAATIGADTWLLPLGIESPFTSNATFDQSVVEDVEADGAVRAVLIARLPVTIAGETLDAILIGHGRDGPGVPATDDGVAAARSGEVAISTFSGAGVGDEIGLGGSTAVVTGTMEGTTLFAGMLIVFTPIDAARDLVAGGRPVVSAVVVDGTPTTVPAGLHALTRDQVVAEAKGPVERPILTLHLVQGLLAVVAAMIIGAVVYLASLERTRDVAVLRAVGTKASMLALGVAAQALVVAVAAAVLAIGLEQVLAPVFPLTVHLTAADLVALPVIAAVVAMASSYLAIRRTLHIDPSEAFAGAGS